MSIRLASLICKRFAHNCVACGLKLVAPQSKGALKPRGDVLSVHEIANRKFNDLTSQLSDEQKKALGIEDLSGEADHIEMLDKTELIEQVNSRSRAKAAQSKVCKPCVMAREGTETPVNPSTEFSTEFAKSNEGRRFWILNATEFPLGMPDLSGEAKESFKDDIFVINRCDLIISHNSQLPKLKRYFMETYFDKHRIPAARVILTSASRNWHLKKLSELFVSKPQRNFFVGGPNSGKTRLVHELSGIPQKSNTGGPTTWPLPFTTQHALAYKSLLAYRAKVLVDTPSNPEGTAALTKLIPNAVRKASAGLRMIDKDRKYKLPVVKGKTGQIISIGGLAAIEFPRIDNVDRQIAIHGFVGIGGLAHTEYARSLSSMDKLHEINASMNEAHLKMRLHDDVGLTLEPALEFHPESATSDTKPTVVIQGLGYIQPFVFGELPENYKAKVWIPQGTGVALRPEMLSYLN